MALFGSKKNTEVKKAEKAVKVAKTTKAPKADKAVVAVATSNTNVPSGVAQAIIRPHVTEKSGVLSQSGVYTFQVAQGANKHTIAKAVAALYKVTPVKVAITNLPAKNVFVRGRKGTVSAIRKAVVTVKKGEKIDFV